MRVNQLQILASDIHQIHEYLGVKHNTEFEQIKTKINAKISADSNHAIIAINPDASSVAFGYYGSSNGKYYYRVVSSSHAHVKQMSLTDAMRMISKDATIFRSIETNQHAMKPWLSRDYNYGEDFLKVIRERFNKAFASKAEAALPQLKEQFVAKCLSPNIDSDSFADARKCMLVIDSISKKGFDGLERNMFGGDSPLRSALKQFFRESYDYMLDSHVSRFLEGEKLGYEKFAQVLFNMLNGYIETFNRSLEIQQ